MSPVITVSVHGRTTVIREEKVDEGWSDLIEAQVVDDMVILRDAWDNIAMSRAVARKLRDWLNSNV